ncbi:phage tail assembly chaperone G [Bacillus velezensis]|uniref:phage tail assembly chaperone G n=1 Tax=Bacillus velezensis TaxID=492670 RepID=UPI002DBF0CB8|nr:hypothetical protein [Bacillus velezensis]MEC0405726.1 hypothetical protein [Bacillus velezensis]
MAQKKHITIKLYNEKEGKFQTYVAVRKNADYLYEALGLLAEAEELETMREGIPLLKKQIAFVVKYFNKQFTQKQFEEGLEPYEIRDEVSRILSEICGFLPIADIEDKEGQSDFLEQ